MKKSEIIYSLKVKEAQSWITLQKVHKLEYECNEMNVEFTGELWKNTCCNIWATYSDLLKQLDIKPFSENQRNLLILQNSLT